MGAGGRWPSCADISQSSRAPRVPRPTAGLQSPRVPLELEVREAAVPRGGVPTSQAAARQAPPPAGGQAGRPVRSLPGRDSRHASRPGSGHESGDSVAWGCAGAEASALLVPALVAAALVRRR